LPEILQFSTITLNDNDLVPSSLAGGFKRPLKRSEHARHGQLSVISGKLSLVPFTSPGDAENGPTVITPSLPARWSSFPAALAEIQITVNEDAVMEPDRQIVITWERRPMLPGRSNVHTSPSWIMTQPARLPIPCPLSAPGRTGTSILDSAEPDPLDVINLVSVQFAGQPRRM
jgi:hypothetical protein